MPEARDSESESDLNHESLSTRLEDEPSEILNPTVRPLNRELARLRESAKDLKSEDFSEKAEDEPSEPVNDLMKLLV
ncbi:hypothetical protein E6H30_03885 [Candidatus Bathyarchaeota archaeon]|nr:MAG: hypothetical protein E6H30_03885 [Candidatus Bathyarchaeota archaeon]